MTKVQIQVVEVLADEHDYKEIVLLELPLAAFTQGAQFGEYSEAKLYAQEVALREQKRAARKAVVR